MSKSKLKLFFFLAPLFLAGIGCNNFLQINNQAKSPEESASSSSHSAVTTPASLTPLEKLIISSVNEKSYKRLIPFVSTPTFGSYLEGSEYYVHLAPVELPKELSRLERIVPLNFDQNNPEVVYIKNTQLSDEERARSFVGFSKSQKMFTVFVLKNNKIETLGISPYFVYGK